MKLIKSLPLSWGLFFSVVASGSPAAPQFSTDSRNIFFNDGSATWTIEPLTDTLVHFEIKKTSNPPHDIPISPYITNYKFTGPAQLTFGKNNSTLSTTALSLNFKKGCLEFLSHLGERLTIFCPQLRVAGRRQLDLTREQTKNIYGLGEKLRDTDDNHTDYEGQIRPSGSQYGNVLEPYRGGYVESALFPIAYFLGPQNLNYALFLDEPAAQTWDFTKDPYRVTLPASDSLRGYFIYGPDLKSLRHQYMSLVGRPPVPQKKLLGLWVSEYGYRNWDQIDEKLESLRSNNFPIDGFVLDLYWFGGFADNGEGKNFGRLTWDSKSFPHAPEKLLDYKSKGIGIAAVEEPYVLKDLGEYQELSDKGFLVKNNSSPTKLSGWWGQGGMVDFTNPAGAQFWDERKRKQLEKDGLDLHWTDLGEPETFDGEGEYYGYASSEYDHTEVANHNIYNLLWAKSIYEGYLRRNSQRRSAILSRSGGPGIQRFGVAMWSGDIGSNMESLEAHLKAQTHLSLSGIDYFGADVGGFHRKALVGDINEVYTRWLAHAALFDFPLRPHTDNGSQKEETSPDRIGDIESNRENIRLRYILSPYYYSLAYDAYLYGDPIIPPLVYEFQEDSKTRQLSDEKMIGPWLMAATSPILNSTSRDVYLPKGDWFNFRNHQFTHSEGQTFSNVSVYNNGLLQLPLFARGGAILPIMDVDDKTFNILGLRGDGIRLTDLKALIFEPSDNDKFFSFSVFEDDGETIDYKSGCFTETVITQHTTGHDLRITVAPVLGKYPGMALIRNNAFEIVTQGHEQPESVQLNGSPLKQFNSPEDLEHASQGWFAQSEIIRIKSGLLSVKIHKDFRIKFR